MSYNARTYQDVLLQLLHALLDTEYNTPHVFQLAAYLTVLQVSPHRFNSYTGNMPFLAGSNYVPTCRSSAFVSLAVCCSGANPLTPHRLALVLSFRTTYLTYCLPPHLKTGVAFAYASQP